MTDARIRRLPPLTASPPSRPRPAAPRRPRRAPSVAPARADRQRPDSATGRLPGRGRGAGSAARGTRGRRRPTVAAARARRRLRRRARTRSAASSRCRRSSNQRVDREIEWLQRNPDYLARVFGRAQRYLHYVANEVEARGLPGRPRAPAGGRERLQPVRLLAQPRLGTLAVHRADRRALRPAAQLLAGPAPRRGRVDARGARVPRAAARPLRRRLVPRDRRLQLRPRQHPARDQPQCRAPPQHRLLLAVAAGGDARLRAEADCAREDDPRAGDATASTCRRSRTRPTSASCRPTARWTCA